MQNGSTHQKYLMEKHPEITAVPYDSYQNAILDLKMAVWMPYLVIPQW